MRDKIRPKNVAIAVTLMAGTVATAFEPGSLLHSIAAAFPKRW